MDRRQFLKSGATGGAVLLIGFELEARGENRRPGSRRPILEPNAWLRIRADNRITVLAEKPEVGQGSRTYIAMMIAEELDVDWSTISVEQAPTIPSVYEGLRTAGSGGVRSSYDPMRRAGAQARELLLNAAAERWRVDGAECRTARGSIVHTASNRKLTYGELVPDALRIQARMQTQARHRGQPWAANEGPARLKAVEDFRIIGHSLPRIDVPSKVDGSAVFGLDVRVPGMLFAVIARCPYFGGKLSKLRADAASSAPGVRAVFEVPPLPRRFNTAGGVAVVAESTWAALRARKLLEIQWDGGPGAAEDTAELRSRAERQADAPPLFVAARRGNAAAAFTDAARIIEASYESPFQAHATMEPMNTTVHVRAGEIEVWSPTQFADEVQAEIAELSGLPADKVIVHMMLSGGSFGRRYQWDYAAEAWQVAKQLHQPVQLVWTREDDLQHDFYRPHNYQRLRAGIDHGGRVLTWTTRVVSTPIAGTNLYTGVAETAENLKDPKIIAALEWYGADVAPYAIPNFLLDYAPVSSAVPRSWWRSVSSSYTIFAKECFMDEIAHALAVDPLQFRLDLLSDAAPDGARLRNVLRLAAEKAEWGRELPPRQGRGMACRADETCSAQVAHVSVDEGGRVRVLRVVSAVDCGIAVNPDGVRAMTEGAINFALTPVLTGEITIKRGAVEQSNFHDYRVLRLNEAPQIEVHIVPSSADPCGVGELGAMLLPPAVANAVFDAVGVRVRRLPIDPKPLAGGTPCTAGNS